MERLEFECVYDLADKITDMLGDISDDYPLIAVYGKYEIIKELLEDLIMSGVSIANEIELEDYEISYYDKEYVLYLTKNGVNVEKAYDVDNERYLYGGGNISFVHGYCNSKLLPYVEEGLAYEFGLGNYDADDDSDDEDSYEINGKSVSKDEFDKYVRQLKDNTDNHSEYRITIKGDLDVADAERIINSMEHRMMHMQDMFDEMNHFRRLFGW